MRGLAGDLRDGLVEHEGKSVYPGNMNIRTKQLGLAHVITLESRESRG